MQPKRLFILLLSLLILATSTAIPTLAANTTDTYITGLVVSGGGEVVYSGSRAKDDDSPMYLLIYNSTTYNTTRVKALGTNSTSATSSNSYNCTCIAGGTRVSYVTCYRGIDYSVHSYVDEDGYNRATYSFMNPNSGTQTVYAEWSPDSWNTHVDATP